MDWVWATNCIGGAGYEEAVHCNVYTSVDTVLDDGTPEDRSWAPEE